MFGRRLCVTILGPGVVAVALATAGARNLQAQGFAVYVSPTNVEISKFSHFSATITVKDQNGWSGTVTLNLSDCPAALSCQLVSTKITGSGQTTLNVWSKNVPGLQQVTVGGTAPGQHDQYATVQVTVL